MKVSGLTVKRVRCIGVNPFIWVVDPGEETPIPTSIPTCTPTFPAPVAAQVVSCFPCALLTQTEKHGQPLRGEDFTAGICKKVLKHTQYSQCP